MPASPNHCSVRSDSCGMSVEALYIISTSEFKSTPDVLERLSIGFLQRDVHKPSRQKPIQLSLEYPDLGLTIPSAQ